MQEEKPRHADTELRPEEVCWCLQQHVQQPERVLLLLLIFLPNVARGKGWGEQGGGRELCWEAPHVLLRGVQGGGAFLCADDYISVQVRCNMKTSSSI